MSVRPRAKVREVADEDEEITSKDLTKKQLVLYIFNDFLRGTYTIGCMFLDGLVILYLYYFIPASYLSKGILSNTIYRDVILGLLILSLEVLVIYYEFKGYRRIWPKGSLFIGHKLDQKLQKN
ncbi:MAG: hypothetical protein M0Z77_03870 [Thermoplasmatales archaeon]|jgi:hypothetical protein|nr:hypothetical protein [Candidatus Thermoplasmatota archaeon]MCL6003579.1 hypothetical protein [Candidatus Thermoplasmatota archaeon]MDA8054776.1 hypothetical protein [Thermoplasmatales archaeon]